MSEETRVEIPEDMDKEALIGAMAKALKANFDFMKYLGGLNEEGYLDRLHLDDLSLILYNYNMVVDESQDGWSYLEQLGILG